MSATAAQQIERERRPGYATDCPSWCDGDHLVIDGHHTATPPADDLAIFYDTGPEKEEAGSLSVGAVQYPGFGRPMVSIGGVDGPFGAGFNAAFRLDLADARKLAARLTSILDAIEPRAS